MMPAQNGLCWDQITGMVAAPGMHVPCPQGILVPDTITNRDKVAVVYDKGNPPPEITIKAITGGVTSVLADGVAVAVVARATGPALSAEDVLLVERTL